MNENILKGKWNQIKGEVQKEWGKLTDNDLDHIEGELKRLQGVVQEKYGYTSAEVKTKVDKFLKKYDRED